MRLKFFQLLFLISIGSSFGLDCKFSFYNFPNIYRQYTCTVQDELNILEPNLSLPSNVTGNHADDKTIDDVAAIIIDNNIVEYLPSNIGELFPNLIALKVKNGRLKELHEDDLRSMPKLRYLNLDDNDIEVLNDSVFDNNLELELVWMSENKITKIGEKLADNFKKLNSLDLTKNICTNKKFSLIIPKYGIEVPQKLETAKFVTLNEIMKECSTVNEIISKNVTQNIPDHPHLKVYQEQINALNHQLVSTRLELNSMRQKLVEEMSARNETERILNVLNNTQTRSHNEVDNSIIADLEIRLKREEKEVKNLKDELKKLRGIHEDFSKIKITLKNYEEERQKFNKQINEDQAEIRQLKAANAELEAKLQEFVSIPISNSSPASENTENNEIDLEIPSITNTTDETNAVYDDYGETVEHTTIYDYYN